MTYTPPELLESVNVVISQSDNASSSSNRGDSGCDSYNTGSGGYSFNPFSAYYTWVEITSNITALINYAYIANNASRVLVNLPYVAGVGDHIRICGKGAGGWQLTQNTNQTVHYGNVNTTTGVSGSILSQLPFDCIELVCITPNTDFLVLNSQGNLTVV